MVESRIVVAAAVVGAPLALVAGAALPGLVTPEYQVAADATGPSEWENLSPEAKAVVRTALAASGPVNATFGASGSYGNNTTEFGPYPDDLPQFDVDQIEPSRMVIERNGTVYVFSARFVGGPGGGTVAVDVVNRTDTARIRRGDLSPHGRTVLNVAETDGAAAFYTDRPPAFEDGLDATPDGLLVLAVADADLFVVADGDTHRTVVVSRPTDFTPLGSALTLAVVAGSLATVPAVALFGARRLGWSLATVAGVAVAVLPVVLARIAAVGPPSLLVRRFRGLSHLVVLPAVGALVCVFVVRTRARRDRSPTDDTGE